MMPRRNTGAFASCIICASVLLVGIAGARPFEDAAIESQEDGEVGTAYPGRGRTIALSSPASWLGGKIEPAAQAAAKLAPTIDVMIYLNPLQGAHGPAVDVEEMKAKHVPQINALSNRLRELAQSPRPTQSLTAEQERTALRSIHANQTPAQAAEMETLRTEIDSRRDDMRSEVATVSRSDRSKGKAALVRLVTRVGGRVNFADHPNGIAANVPSDQLETLAAHPLVRMVVSDRAPDYELDVSVPSAGHDQWWTASTPLDGGAFDFGIIDSGVQQNHPAFSNVNSFYTNSGATTDFQTTSGHGTHVTGIVASSDSTYTGGAFGLDAIIWGYTGTCCQSTTMANMDWLVTGAAQTPEVVNLSIAFGTAWDTDYTPFNSFYDAYVDNFDVMVTNSAGNGGWSDTFVTLSNPATAYNLMTVANMDDQDTTTRADDVRATLSSIGPTLLGRRKPDITAPGEAILSANSGWADTGEADFISKSGTSMAAPHVAAGIILMEDGGNNTPMAQKAVLINTADAWTSEDTRETTDDGPVSGSFWDKSYGWGYLDMDEAYFNRGDYFVDSIIGRNDTNVADDYKLYSGTMFVNEKATLVWEKRAGIYVAGAPSTSQHVLTDINLRLYNEDDGLLIDSEYSIIDNVHQVASNGTIDAMIKVYSWSTTIEGTTSEPFALATEENFTTVTPPDFAIGWSRQNWVGPNQTFDFNVIVENLGGAAAHDTVVVLENISGVTGESLQNIGTVAAAESSGHVYTLSTSGLAAGFYPIDINVVSFSYDETFARDLTANIQVEANPPISGCTMVAPYTNSTTLPISWTASDSQTGLDRSYLYRRIGGASSLSNTGQSASGTSGEFNYTILANGLHEFAIRSRDLGSTWEAVPTVTECETFLDTMTPVGTVSSPALASSGSPISLSWNATDAAPSSAVSSVEFWYRKEPATSWSNTGVSGAGSSGAVNFTPPAGDGVYHFTALAEDNAQNAESLWAATNESTTTVPEPSTSSALITGSLILHRLGRRRRRASRLSTSAG
ncbi:MAG: serine protease AprX [Planctomycetota bacterium]|jgi:serine protease AprX